MGDIKYIDAHRISHRKKKSNITITVDKIIDFSVDYTLLLQSEADDYNIKNAIKLCINRYKEDYDTVTIIF